MVYKALNEAGHDTTIPVQVHYGTERTYEEGYDLIWAEKERESFNECFKDTTKERICGERKECEKIIQLSGKAKVNDLEFANARSKWV